MKFNPFTGTFDISSSVGYAPSDFQYKTFVTVGPSDADYITDGTADDVQIQEALTAAAGGVVYLKQGTYSLTAGILLPTNTTLQGSGMGETILQLHGSSITNFNNDFLLRPLSGADNCKVLDLSLDGNYNNLTSTPTSYGGLLEVGDGWSINQVEFMSSNWFRVWVNDVSDVLIRDCIWTGITGSSYDNIGGGNNTHNVTIENCVWVSGLVGNPINFTGSEAGPCTNIKFIRNKNYSANSAYFEAVTDSLIHGNIFTGGGQINVKSDGSYASHTNAVNPKNVTISENEIYDAGETGIQISYSGKGTPVSGGYNKVINNKVVRAGKGGILIFPGNTASYTDGGSLGHELVSGNHCINCNQDNVSTFNIGNGIIRPSGINITQGLYSTVVGNVCVDDQSVPTQHYGIEFGQSSAPSDVTEADNIVCVGNDVSVNKTGGVNVVSPTYTTSRIIRFNLGANDDDTVSHLLDNASFHVPVRLATAAALPANTYSNGTSGVGARITITNENTTLNIDGITPSVGDRILVKNETTSANNGIYSVVAVGGAGVQAKLDRVTDMNSGHQFPGSTVFVTAGGTNIGNGFVVNNASTFTVGTTSVIWNRFSSTGATSEFNVKSFGANGDGTTDDTAAVQAAFNAADFAGGGVVYFPVGTYILSSILISSKTIALGSGIGSVLKLKNTTNGFMFTTRDTAASPTNYPHDHQFRDLYFDLNMANNLTSAGAIKSEKNRNAIVERCSFVNYKGNCIYFSGGVGNNIQPRFINNQFDMGDRTDGVGIKIDSGCYDSWIVGNDIGRSWRGIILSNGGDGNHSVLNNWTWANADCGIYLYQSHNVLLSNNTQDQNYGTTVNGAGMCVDGCNNVSISNNKASNNSWRDTGNIMGFGVIGTTNINAGIRVFGSSTNIRITSSIFSNPNSTQQYGIQAEGSSSVYYSNCTFTNQLTGDTNAITSATITNLDASTSAAFRTDKLSVFASTTSAELKTVISDETGTGALVFSNSPALVTPTGIVKGDVGLGNVDNTTDANKPISTATQAALNLTGSKTLPVFRTDFLSNNSVASWPFYSTGISSGTINFTTATANHPGVIRILASAGANSGSSIGTGSANTAIVIKGGEFFSAIFYPIAFTNITSRLGFHDSASTSDAANGVYLEINTSGVISGKTAAASSRTSTTSTYTLSTATWYEAIAVVNANATSITYKVYSDAGSLLWTDTVASTIPTAATGIGFTTTTSSGGVTDLMYLDYMEVRLGTMTRGV